MQIVAETREEEEQLEQTEEPKAVFTDYILKRGGKGYVILYLCKVWMNICIFFISVLSEQEGSDY